MDTLLLQLLAPMQSWGVQSLHGERDSGLEPSKSGVVGLLCAALGRERAEPLHDLAALRMGVRVDREGTLQSDFHKAEPLDAAGLPGTNSKVFIGQRSYLADAAFLVGLEGDLLLLQTLQTALRDPVYLLYLGRKAFPPASSLCLPDGLRQGLGLAEALRAYPALARSAPIRRRVLLEDPRGEILVNDQPVSFAQRLFAPRRAHLDYWTFSEEAPCTSPN